MLEPRRPLVVLVHGSDSGPRDFRALVDALEARGQQTVCFRYDDRARVNTSAEHLRRAVVRLVRLLPRSPVTLLGHSQGGLVARAALTARENGDDALPPHDYRLVTISTPFGGIDAASNCGHVLYHIASLGISALVCRAISGAKWKQIHPFSRMVEHPQPLDPRVDEHLAIITDERATCRRRSPDGEQCLQDDFVFTRAEQHNARIERDARVAAEAIAAGHVAAVGAGGSVPRALLDALQRHDVLPSSPLPPSVAAGQRHENARASY